MKIFSLSVTRRERANSYHRPWKTRVKTPQQSFWTHESILSNWICFEHSKTWNVLARIRWWTHWTIVGVLCPIVMKTKHPVHIMMFEAFTRDGDVMSLSIFTYGFSLHRSLRKVPNGGSAALDREREAAGKRYNW